MPYTCRLTIVNDGMSDSVIKVYPSSIQEGKVWLNRVAHKEWWEMVQQNMNRYAERGTRVEKPVPYHADPKNLVSVTLKEENIPLVRMDGWTLPPLPPDEKMPDYTNAQGSMLELNKRIQDLENIIKYMVNKTDSKEPPKPQTQRDDLTSSGVPQFTCCGDTFKDNRGLAAHKRFKHKKGIIQQAVEMVTGKEG